MPHKSLQKRKEYGKKWYQENPEKAKKYSKKQREKYPEYQKDWYQKNPEKRKKYNEKWRKKNPEKAKECNRKWHKANIEKVNFLNERRRVRKKEAEGLHTFAEWELLKKQYGHKCLSCGKCEPEIKLTEDHIIPLDKGGSDYIDNIQPLCRSCNCKKHIKIINYIPLNFIKEKDYKIFE